MQIPGGVQEHQHPFPLEFIEHEIPQQGNGGQEAGDPHHPEAPIQAGGEEHARHDGDIHHGGAPVRLPQHQEQRHRGDRQNQQDIPCLLYTSRCV